MQSAFFGQEIFWNSASGMKLVRFVSCLKCAHEECGGTIINEEFTCDFFPLKFNFHV